MGSDQPRDGAHRFEYTLSAAERDARAAEMRARGANYTEIAEALGYYDRSHAWRALQTAKRRVLEDSVKRLIEVEAQQLDELYVAALDVLETDHVTVSHGRIVKDDDGTPIPDPGPKLAAIRELRALRESFRKLYGLDAATKVSVDAESLGAEIGSLLDRLTKPADADDDSA
jgi:hypothetical protein